jgi:hypothetical protein
VELASANKEIGALRTQVNEGVIECEQVHCPPRLRCVFSITTLAPTFLALSRFSCVPYPLLLLIASAPLPPDFEPCVRRPVDCLSESRWLRLLCDRP